jgi:AraC-like DNA-binding protein
MLAKDIGMSRATLTRKFTKLLGSSPMNYLAIWRIHKACHLLRTSHLSLLEIALAVGFQSDSALSKKFRTEIGVSPGAFRKQYQ